MGKNDELDYLNEERIKLWEAVEALKPLNEKVVGVISEIEEIKKDVSKKTSDYEQEAKGSAVSALADKTSAGQALTAIQATQKKIEEIYNVAEQQRSSIDSIAKNKINAQQQTDEVAKSYSTIKETLAEVTAKAARLEEQLIKVATDLQTAQASKEKLDVLEEGVKTSNERISSIHTQVLKKSREVAKVHDQVFGYTQKDEATGEMQEVSGLKAELDLAYEKLKKDITDSQEWLALFAEQQEKSFADFKNEKNVEVDKLKQRINTLLPNAMTAGLASAYQKKREDEEAEREKVGKLFVWTIVALGATSLIPIGVSLYNLKKDIPLQEVITDLPSLAFAIIPLYLPIFWLAISANKRAKLSKRLIEEYTHKEALSKTYEGLSTQISEIEDSEMAKDLRARLLYNMVSISAENPGTLIPDFNESDNPLFEALNKSMALSESLEKFTKIPGIQLILNNVNKRIEIQEEKIGTAVVNAASVVDEGLNQKGRSV